MFIQVIAGTTGQCLAIRNETTVQGNTVTGVDCAGTMPAMSWAISNGFLFSVRLFQLRIYSFIPSFPQITLR